MLTVMPSLLLKNRVVGNMCTHTDAHAHTDSHARTHMRTCMYTHTDAHIIFLPHTHAHKCMHNHIHIHTDIHGLAYTVNISPSQIMQIIITGDNLMVIKED